MATYLPVPLKRTWEVDFTKPLSKFISDTYSAAKPDEYNQSIQEFGKLRSNIITKAVDKHESALDSFYRYHDQLVAIENKFPISENQLRINFKWQDAFDKESLLSGKKTLSLSSSSYEKVCVLFNIAAMQSQIATVQDHTSDEGLKTAAKLFMQSATIFSHLKDCSLSSIPGDPTPDLQPDVLTALSALMLAQAQECFVRKAIQTEMKPAVIAKLSQCCTEMYATVIKQLQLNSIHHLWPKSWIPSVAQSQAAFHALAELHQSLVAKEAKEFGEEIARLKYAKELMASAETRGGYTFSFQKYSKRINISLADAEKDNNLIYHARVPDKSSLTSIGKAAVAKLQDLPMDRFSDKFTDLFDKVVPLAVHQAMTGFDNRKSEVVNAEIGRLREATQLLVGALQSLNLPAAIEDLEGVSVPASIVEKSDKIKEMGGIQYLSGLMNELPELLTRNRQILDEGVKQLDDEAASDKQLRTQFGERWTRTPSDKLTQPMRAEADKYRKIIDTAVGADKVVREQFNQHQNHIKLLSSSKEELARALPSGGSGGALKGSKIVTELAQLCEKAETIKAEREVIESEFKAATFDVSGAFLSALAADGAIDEQDVSNTELDRVFKPLKEQVTDTIHRQESLLANIQRCNDQFISAKSQNTGAASRDEMLKDLAAAYNSYTQLKGNLEEGTKFYNELTLLLVKFQSRVQDLCFARKTEKEELLKDLNSSIANQRPTAVPSTPTYQQPTVAPVSSTATAPTLPPQQAPPPQSTAPPAPSYGAAAPAYPGYGAPPPAPQGGLPYPTQPAYVPPPQPMAYNPYMAYGAPPPQPYAYPPQQHPPPQYAQQPQQQPPYPGYNQQQQWGQ